MSDALWVFGYGSLIWRPDIPYDAVESARLPGWARRFWQGSTDHRGTPEAPGRVVTLVEDPESHTVGRIFRVPPEAVEGVLARLDHREKDGYLRRRLEVEAWSEPGSKPGPKPATPTARTALVYMAAPGNPQWLGPGPDEALARHIGRSHGPSGSNREYLLRLRDALRELGEHDGHVEALAALLED